MKKLIAILMVVLFLASCTTTFQTLPQEQKTELIIETVVIAGVAVFFTTYAIVNHEEVFTVGF